MLKRSGPSIEPWGTPKSIRYQSLRVVSSLLDNYKLVLVSLSQRHKHEI